MQEIFLIHFIPHNSMKIMLDECIHGKKLRKKFKESEDYDVLTSFELGYKESESDEVLVKGTSEHKRVLLTIDFSTITEDVFPPCLHGGILQFNRNKITPDYVLERLKALRQLELEDKAVGHFTYFTDDGIKIVTHTEIIERKFDDYDELRNIERG